MKHVQRITIVVFLLVCIAFALLTVQDRILTDHIPPQLLCDQQVLELSVTDPPESLLQGVTARDNRDGDLTGQVLIQSVSPLITDDTAIVSYVVFDAARNYTSLSRTLHYVDYHKPAFSLLRPLVFQTGTVATLKNRLHAEDAMDGDLSGKIRVISQNIDMLNAGTYSMTVQVTNSMGDSATLPLKVLVSDQALPQQIYLTDYVVYLPVGAAYDPAAYVEYVRNPDYSLGDADQVVIQNQVDTAISGVYDVQYSYTHEGQTYSLYQTVVVGEA